VARADAAALSSVMVFFLIPYHINSTNMAYMRTMFKVGSKDNFGQFGVLGSFA
jgi:hypothetical protein